MGYKNPTEMLVDATKLPAAIEDKLPAGAPKISATLVNIAQKLPKLPDFFIEIPLLPAVPLPTIPGADELKRIVTGAEITPAPPPAPPPRVPAVRPEREKVPLVFE